MRTLVRSCFDRLHTLAGMSRVAVAIALCFAALTASPQNTSRATTAQAELHIQVHVVPAVILPHRHRHRDDDSIAYNFALDPQKFSVIEEIRPFIPQGAPSQMPGAILQTTTIVLK